MESKLREFLESKGLSKAEVNATLEVAKGLSNSAAAANLFVCDKTIKYHMTKVFKKLGVKSRSELIVMCAKSAR